MDTILLSDVQKAYPVPDEGRIVHLLDQARQRNQAKIVVLDDDPTGVQTVHGVNVYTDWTYESLLEGFEEPDRMFYILTNSRSFTAEETKAVHEEIARNIFKASRQTRKDYIIISRGDSTLRGHWPLEPETLKTTIEHASGDRIDGEILVPFFKEGGRYTAEDVHYVADNGVLTPAGDTEFARDKTFGYTASNLREWVEEKSHGTVQASEVCSISLAELRACDIAGIERKLLAVGNFGKVIVNALDYCDVEVFCTALFGVMNRGRHFLLRTASAVPKVLGGISDRPLLTRQELLGGDYSEGGLIIVGSHVKKTSDQLAELQSCKTIRFIEFNQHLVLQPELFKQEIARVVTECESNIRAGKTVAVYTRREMLNLGAADKEEELKISVEISRAVTRIVEDLKVRPAFIIAKGGITSSDIGVRGLQVRRAMVLGQILAGIPVWKTGPESRFPGMPYVIFPGNVGGKTALKQAAQTLCGKD